MKGIIEILLQRRPLAWIVLGVLAIIVAGAWSLSTIPKDAIPDVSDRQVIIYCSWAGQDPQVIEDQVTYPLITTMLHVPRIKAVRGYTDFGFSLVYVLLGDRADYYWSRSRILEYLDQLRSSLPNDPNLSVGLGPDASGVGWVYEYALTSKTKSLSDLRSLEDWYLRYGLQSVPGVAEVASLGGAVREYQINVDPLKLRAYGISLREVIEAVRNSNLEEGGRWVENAGAEYLIRGLGYVKKPSDLQNVVLKSSPSGVPVTIGQVAHVVVGMQERRGAADLDGAGQAVGGVVVARIGADVSRVVSDVKTRLQELTASIGQSVNLTPVYDRSIFIAQSWKSVLAALIEEAIIVTAVVFVFLGTTRGALAVLAPLPIALLGVMVILRTMGMTLDIMILSGIAIAVGTMVDAGIVIVENVHKHLERLPANGLSGDRSSLAAVITGIVEVLVPLLVSLTVIALAFLPVLLLQGEEGKLFKPLVLSKTFAVLGEMLLIVVLTPALVSVLRRGKIKKEEVNPINRILMRGYHRLLFGCLHRRIAVLIVTAFIGAVTIGVYFHLGSEFMPSVYEGDVMFMPTTLPSVSISEMQNVVERQDKALMSIPEVASVFGKTGRAESATDPAPLSMIETVIHLKPQSMWRSGLTYEKLVAEMNQKVGIPGLVNSWTMPIRGRIDMLGSGIKTPLGIKVFGRDYAAIDQVAHNIQKALRTIPGTRNVYADQTKRGRYLDVSIDRDALARYGLSVADVQRTIRYGIGGIPVGKTIEGLERYPIAVRFIGDARGGADDILRNALVYSPTVGYIPLGYVADVRTVEHPVEIKTENGMLVDYVYVDPSTNDLGGYVERADKAIKNGLALPEGTYYQWSGQYEGIQRTARTMSYVIPLVVMLIAILYYSLYRSASRALLVLLAVPFSLIGAIWLMAILHYQVSAATAVGMIALAGVSAQTAVVMIVYLDLAIARAKREGRLSSRDQLFGAIYEGAVLRLRPKTMTVIAIAMSLLPILATQGIGADVAKRIAAPMVGGILSSALLVLLVIPILYSYIEERRMRREADLEQG